MRLTRADIDLDALRFNLAGVRKRVSDRVKIMGVVKANAYGHGFLEIAHALVRFGADYLGAGFLEEGVMLRQHGITTPILVLGGVLGNQIRDFLEHDLEITVSSLEVAERINHEVPEYLGRKARVHLKIDTGMERIGVRSDRAPEFVERVQKLPHIEVVGVYSHLATADERDKSFAREQLAKFHEVVTSLKQIGIEPPLLHIANSGAVLDMPESFYTMVRPGIMLYGVYPSKETSESIPLQPVLSLKSKVVFLKEVPAGTGISYGRRYYTKERTRVATVPIGYGDGYPRRLTNRGYVLIGGKKCPIIGTVCMDQLMVDVGFERPVHIGDEVTLIGRDGDESIGAWDVAEHAETIPYEIFTGISSRVPRRFLPTKGE
jgi:alanine racemase